MGDPGSAGEGGSRNTTWWIVREKSESHPNSHQSWMSDTESLVAVRYPGKIRLKERMEILQQRKFTLIILLCSLWSGMEEIR